MAQLLAEVENFSLEIQAQLAKESPISNQNLWNSACYISPEMGQQLNPINITVTGNSQIY